MKYNFDQLKTSLMSCFPGSDGYYIEPRVFTISIGNCTSSRVEKLFSKLCLDDDIFTSISNTTELKRSVMETRKNAVSQLRKEKLDRIIHIRNDIAHGELTVSISKDEFDDTGIFLRSLKKALAEKSQSFQTL
ncbi:MAE_28990/MAE_18760 family HEPN-like nuclease [Klebsiella sp. CN_Kp098]|uniref:HEPN domain-containing protein n=1 Tax=unclassified Klebsiella TaxID=2608929 RepID=UPI0032B5915C